MWCACTWPGRTPGAGHDAVRCLLPACAVQIKDPQNIIIKKTSLPLNTNTKPVCLSISPRKHLGSPPYLLLGHPCLGFPAPRAWRPTQGHRIACVAITRLDVISASFIVSLAP